MAGSEAGLLGTWWHVVTKVEDRQKRANLSWILDTFIINVDFQKRLLIIIKPVKNRRPDLIFPRGKAHEALVPLDET